MGKKCQSDFDHGMIVGARQGGLSISQTGDLLGFSCTTLSWVWREWCEKQKNIQWAAVLRANHIVNERSDEKGQTGRSWQEGDSNANNHALQQWYAKELVKLISQINK